MRRAVIALTLVVAACSGGGGESPFPDGAFVIPASSDLAVGEERLLLAVSDETGSRLASPDIEVTIDVHPEGEPDAVISAAGEFLWAIEDVSGLYRARFEFDRAGVWEVVVTPEGGDALRTAVFVQEDPLTPAIGDPAPLSDSVTAADAPLQEITTDPSPDPGFYQLSIADAVTSGRPTVVVFATPRFCQTAICGPTLETIRGFAGEFSEVNFVHVEVFTNLDDPENLEVVPAVVEWGLPTEPWIFVVDGSGIVIGRFEGLVTADEITDLLG